MTVTTRTSEPTPEDQIRQGEAPEPRMETSARSAEDLTAAAAEGLRWMSMSRVGTEIVLFLAMVVLARLIPPSAFGAYSVALIVAGLAWGIPTEGVGSAMVQRESVTREHLEAGGALTLMAAVGCTLLTLALSVLAVEPLCGSQAASLVSMSAPLFLLTALGTVSTALLRRRLDFQRLALMEIVGNGVRVGVALALAALAGLGGSALVLGGLAGTLVTTGIALLAAPAPLPRWRRKAARDLLGYGLPASLATIAWAGFTNGDYAVVTARLGTTASGLYWRAYTLAVGYQSKISVLMSTVAFPVLARSSSDEDMLALRSRTVRLLTVVLFPLLTGLAITAPFVVPAVFGPAWQAAVVPTQLLCAGGAATLVINAIGAAFMAAGRARALLGYGVAHFVVYVGTVVVVAPLGIAAVAADASIVHGLFVIVAYVMLLRGKQHHPLRSLWADISPATIASFGMAVVAVPVNELASASKLPPILGFLAVLVVSALTYPIVLRIASRDAWHDLCALARRLLPKKVLDARRTLSRVIALRLKLAGQPD